MAVISVVAGLLSIVLLAMSIRPFRDCVEKAPVAEG
jgi:hypothetical protein